MFQAYKLLAAHLLTRWWQWVIVFWIGLAIALRLIAPSWNRIAQDGDFQFMPSSLPSRVGQKMLDQGFPEHRARSQLVIIAARSDEKMKGADIAIPLDIARQFMHASGVATYRRMQEQYKRAPSDQGKPPSAVMERTDSLKLVLRFFDEAIELDSAWFDVIKSAIGEGPLLSHRLAVAYWDRAALHAMLGETEKAQADSETARILDPGITSTPDMTARPDFPWQTVLDVWTWRDPVLGSKLGDASPNAKLVALQLDVEFISTKNVQLLSQVEALIAASRELHQGVIEPGLEVGVSGSAAVGGDMLRAAAGSVQQTEWVTVGMILIILAFVYRGPLLVAIPIATIALSLLVSTSVISLLANDPMQAREGRGLQVFTTTRIFLVVLLFGAGTDFCLFFIARCRELFSGNQNPSRKQVQRMVASSWHSVHDALLGSALTTIVGLGLMYFSDFEKFRFTGPIIGLGLTVTILVCLTFTPAVVCGLGRLAFWPTLGQAREVVSRSNASRWKESDSRWIPVWERFTDLIIARPIWTLGLCLLFLGIPAIEGWRQGNEVTYDFAKELSPQSPSRQGTRLVEQYFNTRDSSPLTVVVSRKESSSDEKELRAAIEKLRRRLYVQGVTSVRSLTDPLGDYPPERRMSLFGQDAWRRRLLENHPMTQQLYVATNPDYAGRIARLDVLLEPSPFSTEAEEILRSVQRELTLECLDEESPWFESTFACTGTTPESRISRALPKPTNGEFKFW